MFAEHVKRLGEVACATICTFITIVEGMNVKMNNRCLFKKLINFVDCYMDDIPFEQEMGEEFLNYVIENKMIGIADQIISNGYESAECKKKIDEKKEQIEKKYMYGQKISKFILENNLKCFMSKGFLLGHQTYDSIYARCFGDIDFFCSRKDIFRLCAYIESLGFVNELIGENRDSLVFDDRLKHAHYENDNENVFYNEKENCYIEVKLGDFIAHGGFSENQIHQILIDNSAVISYKINGHNFPSLNLDYTLLLLISNAYRNFNTHTGQILDFKIRDLVDICFYLKKYDYINKMDSLRPLLEKYNKKYEFYVVLT